MSTQESADQLCDRLLRHLDQNDRLLVIKVVKPFQGFLTEKAWEWIRAHVTES